MPETLRSIAALATIVLLAASLVYLSACSTKSKRDPFAGIGSPMYKGEGPLPKGGGRREIGIPYEVAELWFYPKEDPSYDKTGVASWYGKQFHRRMTSNGEWFDMEYLSAAHTTLPLPSYAKVTNLGNRHEIVVRINDRGPFVDDRIIDLSRKSADALGFRKQGTTAVRVQYIGPAPLNDQGSHLAAMNRELKRGTPVDQLIAAAGEGMPEEPTQVSLVAAAPQPQWVEASALKVADAGYFIQVGAFSNFGNAERARTNLADLGTVQVTPVSSGVKTLYRVTLGPLAVSSAEDALSQVQAQGHHDARLLGVRN
ncbi:MAG: septal ring lytic transglycosylase RlpA family protein [Pseudomonadota bacterium]|nr:septal ring lytic transglycosylase RlpA family protein [Pseudomonadota bacterium]